MTGIDAQAIKERERNSWRSAAEGWQRRDALLREGAAPVSEWMLSRAGIAAGHRVLDIASGTGEPAISAAHLVGEEGRVIGTDLVEEMLVFARQKAQQTGAGNIEFHCTDGELLEFPPASFDAATLRWGLMFMPQPERCLATVHRLLKPGARMTLACWSDPDKNPFISMLTRSLGKFMELPRAAPGAPGIFAFADPQRLQSVIEAAGFQDVELEEMVIDFIEVDSGKAYWDAMSDLAAPVMLLVEQLDATLRERFVEDVISSVEALKQDGVVRLRGTTWLACATR